MSETETEGRGAAPAVVGVMAALKGAADEFTQLGLAASAQKCQAAVKALEDTLAEAFARVATPKAQPTSPSALFRLGFHAGEVAAYYASMSEPVTTWNGDPPPATWDAAWAIARAQLATGQG